MELIDILLINSRLNHPDKRTISPPLGLAYLCASLSQNGINNAVLDCNLEESELINKLSCVRKNGIVAFSCMTPNYNYTVMLSKYIRLISSGMLICVSITDFYSKSEFLLGCLLNKVVLECNLSLFKKQNTLGMKIINLEKLISKCGYTNAYSNRNHRRWNSKYSSELYKSVAKEIYKCYLVNHGKTKKCIVLDCDNVLWGGVLSEDGIENIKLAGSGFGRLYQDFQRFVLSLYNHGVILAICSKNDLTDVLNVFREHSEMILKEEHIACFQVNWDDKPGNLKTIAEKLNIGLDSIVFVDDSPVEIEAVKTLLPDVTTILFHRDMDYSQFSCFTLKRNVSLADIEQRNKTYRTNARRDELKEQSCSYEEFVIALDIKTEIHRIVPMEYSRVSELTQRTNKCTSGRRFTVQEIKDLIENGETDFYTVHVSDRFSDLGIVGAFAINNNELALFSLSCRALGRGIENTMLEYILSNWKIESVAYHSTGKNTCLKELIEEKILMKQPFM